MTRHKSLWQIIQTPSPRDRGMGDIHNPVWRFFVRFMLRPNKVVLPLLLVLVTFWGMGPFLYAWAMAKIADDVVEVHLIREDLPAGTDLDPTLPTENRRFATPEPHDRSSLVERLEQRPGKTTREKLDTLTWIAIVLIIAQILRHLVNLAHNERTIVFGQRAMFRIRQQIHDKFNVLPLSYHDQYAPGRLQTNLFSDVQRGIMACTMLLRQIPPAVTTLVIGVIILFYIKSSLAMWVLPALPVYALCYAWFRSRFRNVFTNLREREGRLNAHIANRISNFRLVKSCRAEFDETRSFIDQARPNLQFALGGSLLQIGFLVICSVLAITSISLSLWYGVLAVRDGQLTAGQLVAFYTVASNLFQPISVLSGQTVHLYNLRAAAVKIIRVLDEPITLTNVDEPLPAPKHAPQLRFDAVTMRYAETDHDALIDVSFSLPANQRMAIMGPSGSGKSTLAKLAVRLYDPTRGVVTLDGVDIRRYRLSSLRRSVTFVPQEPVVFSGTLEQNIRYGSESASVHMVIAAAQYAQIHDYIHQLPERYQTLTQQRGLTLSGGQKQRVNLARALLADPRLLVLDDCTSALDAETEAKLIASFRDSLQDRTTLLVTHRVNLAMECDWVIMMDRGRIAEIGPPRKLLQNNGPFTQVYQSQMGKVPNSA